LAVFSHADGGAAVVERKRRTYSGRVEFGEDWKWRAMGRENLAHVPAFEVPRRERATGSGLQIPLKARCDVFVWELENHDG
jgi:hypothetical protein